jgi:hypothetical protein
MYNVEELVAMLQNGKTAEEIANEMGAVLTEAAKQVEAEKEAARVKAMAEREAARKRDAAAEVFSVLTSYLLEFHPDSFLAKEMTKPENQVDSKALDDLVEQMDGMVEMFEAFKMISSLGDKTAKEVKPKVAPKAKTADPLEDFLNMFVR